MIAFLIAAFCVVAVVVVPVVGGTLGWVLLGAAALCLGLGLGVASRRDGRAST